MKQKDYLKEEKSVIKRGKQGKHQFNNDMYEVFENCEVTI